MTSDLIRRVIGESDAAQNTSDTAPPAPATDSATPTQPDQANVEKLFQMWNAGKEEEVAVHLMFTASSYVDFVALSFKIGQESAVKLGSLLDKIADSQDIPVPEPSGDYATKLHNPHE
jgi:hypothetical protein